MVKIYTTTFMDHSQENMSMMSISQQDSPTDSMSPASVLEMEYTKPVISALV